eukprot:Hpha_TRINITY_DN16685_c7_g1::TRINITY_DN16685_c7_g1_i1::g.179080::m.179080
MLSQQNLSDTRWMLRNVAKSPKKTEALPKDDQKKKEEQLKQEAAKEEKKKETKDSKEAKKVIAANATAAIQCTGDMRTSLRAMIRSCLRFTKHETTVQATVSQMDHHAYSAESTAVHLRAVERLLDIHGSSEGSLQAAVAGKSTANMPQTLRRVREAVSDLSTQHEHLTAARDELQNALRLVRVVRSGPSTPALHAVTSQPRGTPAPSPATSMDGAGMSALIDRPPI